MRLNPIYKNELKLLGRSKQMIMYILLFNMSLLIVSIISLYIIRKQSIADGTVPYGSMSSLYFIVLTIEICLLTVLVPPVSAGSIAGERERQTLDILLSSGLPLVKIVSGKFLSSVSLAVLLILSSAPIMALATIYGGIGIEEVYKSMAYTILYVLLAASAGLFCSCFFKKTTSATVASFIILLIMTIGSIILVTMITIASNYAETNELTFSLICMLLWLFNPAITYINVAAEEDIMGVFFNTGDLRLMTFIQEHYIMLSILVQVMFILIMMMLAVKCLKRYCEGK